MARLLFFGKLGDIAQGRARDFPLGANNTVPKLKAAISETDRALGEALAEPSIRCIVNEEIARNEAAITDDDEIAFLPPVSGG